MDYGEHFEELGTYERHLNNVQIAVRGFASSWVVAAGAGIGAVLLAKLDADAVFTKADLVAAIALVASVGIFGLWLLDQYVYHRLLNGVFLAGLGIELSRPDALPLRMCMVQRTPRGASLATTFLYASFLVMLLFITWVVLVETRAANTDYGTMPILFLAVIGLSIAALFVMRSRTSGRSAALEGEFGQAMKNFWGGSPEDRMQAIVARFRGRYGGKVVITGGEYSGKTQLIGELHKRKLNVVAESAIDVLGRLAQQHGSVEKAAAWRAHNMTEFQKEVALLQASRERAAPAEELVLLDRGLHDGFAFCQQAGRPAPPQLWENAAACRYAAVFVLDTLEPFVSRAATGRAGTLEESLKIRELVETIYRACGIPVYRVQVFSPLEAENLRRRALFIVDKLTDEELLSPTTRTRIAGELAG